MATWAKNKCFLLQDVPTNVGLYKTTSNDFVEKKQLVEKNNILKRWRKLRQKNKLVIFANLYFWNFSKINKHNINPIEVTWKLNGIYIPPTAFAYKKVCNLEVNNFRTCTDLLFALNNSSWSWLLESLSLIILPLPCLLKYKCYWATTCNRFQSPKKHWVLSQK